ncbi:MAG: hypothetical protein IJA77_10680 [Clostridia bacterium]|nr:hypothetical protein [Clostridia bacterium]
MNAKRIWACAGLFFMAVSIICMCISGFIPGMHELLLSISGVTFLLAAAILGVFVMRRRNEEAQKAAEDENESQE